MELPTRADTWFAVALTLAMAAGVAVTGPAGVVSRVGAVVASAGLMAMAQRRRRPLPALGAAIVVVLVEVVAAPSGSEAPAFLAIMIATYSLAAYGTPRQLVVGLAAAVAGVCGAQYLGPPQGYSHGSAIAFFVGLLVLAPTVVGTLAGTRHHLARRLRDSVETLERLGEQRVTSQVAAERDRVTSDIELVVLRGLDELRTAGQARTLDQVGHVERIAREVLGAMRSLVGDLRIRGTEGLRPIEPLAVLRARVQAALPEVDKPDPRSELARRSLLGPALADRLLGVGVAVYAVVAVGLDPSTVGSAVRFPTGAALTVATILPLAWSRRAPLRAVTVCAAATVAYVAVALPPDPLGGLTLVPCTLIAPLVVGLLCRSVRAVAGLAMCLGATTGAAIVDSGADVNASVVVPLYALVVGCWAAGVALHSAATALAAQADAVVSERAEQAALVAQRVRAERARLARELHDAAGHALTVIVLQATAARRVWHTAPDLAAEHVRVLGQTVAEVVSELRPLVLWLAMEDPLEPRTNLDALVSRARTCGLRVKTYVSAPIDHTTYRLVQEALTNAARHSPGAVVSVTVREDGGSITVEVTNGPPQAGMAAAPPAGPGHGLRGMAERVAAREGSLAAGSLPDGGFVVRATLPAGDPSAEGSYRPAPPEAA
ncbi:sensor histidine kinase [Sphaerisporangium perillae]|uniref:sensor histidine kinase n=1 Tax=Sphaerisporangium perillae TaxID=2935860 RepID=UPI00200C3A11|nr:histidine kinase [Sphaerisporangium perillae]